MEKREKRIRLEGTGSTGIAKASPYNFEAIQQEKETITRDKANCKQRKMQTS